MYNLLTEPLIRYDCADGSRVPASLPEVFTALMADTVEAFPALRPHQRHAWHAFLVQLGAMAMHRAGLEVPPQSVDEWARIIRGLTPEWPDDEPWHLVVEDIIKPAFMQAPSSSKERIADYKRKSLTPDQLDPLDMANNHDLKRFVVPAAEKDSWIFALITEQTTDAHMANNPAISRISGKGSRLAFSLAPSPVRVGTHVRRDIIGLLSQWESIAEGYPTNINGHQLLWTLAWDGLERMTLAELHPLYIEICRRRRLHAHPDGSLYARRARGTSTRIVGASTADGKAALKGRTGDPWIPVNIQREKALTLSSGIGYTYRCIVDCLNLAGRNAGNWALPLLCKTTESERDGHQPMTLVCRGTAPGKNQRKTGGYYERVIPLRSKTAQVFGRRDDTVELGKIAEERIQDIARVEDILHLAIATFAADGDSNKKRHRNGKPSPSSVAQYWVNALDEIIDIHFFEELQDEFDKDSRDERDVVRNQWREVLVRSKAYRVLFWAQQSLPCKDYYRAAATAQNIFRGRVYTQWGISVEE